MSRDIHQVLRDAAPEPSGPPDLAWIRGRGRRLIVTRIAAVASVVLVAVAGAAGVVLTMVEANEVPPPVVEQPSPAPEVADGCAPAPYRPTYLPWGGEDDPVLVEAGDADRDDNDAHSVWSADPGAFDPTTRRTAAAPTVELTTIHDPDAVPAPTGPRELDVAGHTGWLVWDGEPGQGDVGVVWREQDGACGAHALWLSTVGIDAHVDIDRPGSESRLEDELAAIASSLVAWEAEEAPADETGAEAAQCTDLAGSSPEPADDQVAVYFYCEGVFGEGTLGLVPVTREVPDDVEPIEAALSELLAGPRPDEEAQGFTSTLAQTGDVALLDAQLAEDNTSAIIDLTGLPDELTPEQASFVAPGFMEEIAGTVFNLDDDIDAIELRLDGSCDAFWDLLTGESCRPYTRNNWGHIPEE